MFGYRILESDDDLRRLVSLRNRYFPDNPVTLEEQKGMIAMLPARFEKQRWGVFSGGELVACFAIEREDPLEEGREFLFVMTEESVSRQDVDAFVQRLLELGRDRGSRSYTAMTSSLRPDLRDAWEAVGAEFKQENPVSAIDLRQWDMPAEPVEGVTIRRFDFLNEPEALQREHYDMFWEAMLDVPWPTPMVKEPFEEFVDYFKAPLGRQGRDWVAMEGDRILGMSQVRPFHADTGNMGASTGFTGVRKEARRRGLARALKCHALQDMKALGRTMVYTDNEENNPMYQLNLQLGFRQVHSLFIFTGTL